MHAVFVLHEPHVRNCESEEKAKKGSKKCWVCGAERQRQECYGVAFRGQRARFLERCVTSSVPPQFEADITHLIHRLQSPCFPISPRRTYPPPLFSPFHSRDSPLGPASVSRKLWSGLLHVPPHTRSLTPPLLFFDGPINSRVFNSFGHHNPSSSKALSFLLQRGKKTTGCYQDHYSLLWACSGNTGLFSCDYLFCYYCFDCVLFFLAVVTGMFLKEWLHARQHQGFSCRDSPVLLVSDRELRPYSKLRFFDINTVSHLRFRAILARLLFSWAPRMQRPAANQNKHKSTFYHCYLDTLGRVVFDRYSSANDVPMCLLNHLAFSWV